MLRAGVWLRESDAIGSASTWRCEQCEQNEDILLKRGQCGGPFLPRYASAQLNKNGRYYVSGRAIVPGADGLAFMGAEFYSCPVAEALSPFGLTARAMELWRWSDGGRHLRAELSMPTIAAREALDIIGDEVARVRTLKQRTAERDAERAREAARSA